MTQLVAAATGDGTVLFEVNTLDGVGPERVSRTGGNVIARLDERLQESLDVIRPAAESVIHTFSGLGLEGVEVEFGVTLDAEAGAIIARTGVSGHFTVKLSWKTPESSAA
jgi:hypothetical protein